MVSGGFVCGGGGAPADALRTLTQLAHCCIGAAEHGPGDCTCWEPEYELEQQTPDTSIEPTTRATMCADCAYRPDSPERSGDPNYQHSDEDGFSELAAGVFWCHQGMRKPLRWRHPAGISVEAIGDYYSPPLRERDGELVPFRADGTPGERCAGWAAHRRRESDMLADVMQQAGEQ